MWKTSLPEERGVESMRAGVRWGRRTGGQEQYIVHVKEKCYAKSIVASRGREIIQASKLYIMATFQLSVHLPEPVGSPQHQFFT